MTTDPMTRHRTKMAIHDSLHGHLVVASTMRGQRPGFVDGPDGYPECEWVAFERSLMHELTNKFRAETGLEPVDGDRIMWAERQASGHVDYATKFALYCAEIAVGER